MLALACAWQRMSNFMLGNVQLDAMLQGRFALRYARTSGGMRPLDQGYEPKFRVAPLQGRYTLHFARTSGGVRRLD